MEKVKKRHKNGEIKLNDYLEYHKDLVEFSNIVFNDVEKLPENADKRQKFFIKDSRMTERIMDAICDDVKEAKEVKKEAAEIIKEIAKKVESSMEIEYFEDKKDPWEYKIGYCSLENGVSVEQRCWSYRGFTVDWIEDIRMLFLRLEDPYLWWCDFDDTFRKLEEAEKDVNKWENEERREKELQVIDIYRKKHWPRF
jgi:hypothetical protein